MRYQCGGVISWRPYRLSANGVGGSADGVFIDGSMTRLRNPVNINAIFGEIISAAARPTYGGAMAALATTVIA